MALIRNGNVELTVDETEVESFLKKGFDEIDSKGKIKKEATAGKNISIEEHMKEIDVLKAQIAKLSKKAE
ncbi:MAG: hypothetical protein RSC44_05835 [Clostridia bacterium]